jgi:hypothetical protein
LLKSVETCNIPLETRFPGLTQNLIDEIILASVEHYWPYPADVYWPYGNYDDLRNTYLLADLQVEENRPEHVVRKSLCVYYSYEDNIYYSTLLNNSKYIQVEMKNASSVEKIKIKRQVLQLNFPGTNFTSVSTELIIWCFREEDAHELLCRGASINDVESELSRRSPKRTKA